MYLLSITFVYNYFQNFFSSSWIHCNNCTIHISHEVKYLHFVHKVVTNWHISLINLFAKSFDILKKKFALLTFECQGGVSLFVSFIIFEFYVIVLNVMFCCQLNVELYIEKWKNGVDDNILAMTVCSYYWNKVYNILDGTFVSVMWTGFTNVHCCGC